MAVAAAIPWKVILKALPMVVVTAKELWNYWSSMPKTAPVVPNVALRLAALRQSMRQDGH